MKVERGYISRQRASVSIRVHVVTWRVGPKVALIIFEPVPLTSILIISPAQLHTGVAPMNTLVDPGTVGIGAVCRPSDVGG